VTVETELAEKLFEPLGDRGELKRTARYFAVPGTGATRWLLPTETKRLARVLTSWTPYNLASRMPDGRTTEQALAEALIEEALEGKHRLAAICAIYDRIEGKPRQSLDLHDTRREMREELANTPTDELVERLRQHLAAVDAEKNSATGVELSVRPDISGGETRVPKWKSVFRASE
jgi:hypothetical protein